MAADDDVFSIHEFAYVTGAFVISVLFVIVLVNCVCGETKSEPQVNGEGSKKKAKSKRSSKKSKKENGAVTSNDVEMRDVTSRDRNSGNLSNSSASRDSTGTRPKSQHDGSRALPEIPNGEISFPSADKNLHSYATVPGEQDSQTYAAVSEGTSAYDPDYAGISTDTASDTYARVKDGAVQRSDSDIKRAAKNSHPYAEVRNIGEATYAQISEKPSTRRKTVTSTYSVDTVDSATLPPVPEKNLDLLESGSNRSSAATAQASSPSLPPRNSVLDSASIPYADEGSPQHAMYDVSSDCNTASGKGKKEPPYDDITARESLSHIRARHAQEEANHVTSYGGGIQFDREYDEIKSVPASGNARNNESRGQPGMAGDRNSLTSDLYAEIGQNEQAAGVRTSLYAQVGDVDNNHAPTPPPIDTLKQLSNHDGGITRNRPMSAYSTGSSTYHTVGEIDISTPQPQPIYSVPKRKQDIKRHTMHAGDTQAQCERQSANVVPAGKNVVPENNEQVEHLYSQVDKSHKTRHQKQDRKPAGGSYDNVLTDSFRSNGARPKLTPVNHNSNRNDTPTDLVSAVTSSQNIGVQGPSEGATTRAGYQTIGSVSNMPIEDDPDYDTVQEGGAIIIDSYDGYDYESLPGSAAAVTVRNSSHVNNQNGGLALSGGGDTNANPFQNGGVNESNLPAGGVSNTDANRNSMHASMHGSMHASMHSSMHASTAQGGEALIHISEHQPRTRPYHRREHIYEVITDRGGQENIYTADPTRHVMQRRHGGGTEGDLVGMRGSRGESPQEFVSSL